MTAYDIYKSCGKAVTPDCVVSITTGLGSSGLTCLEAFSTTAKVGPLISIIDSFKCGWSIGTALREKCLPTESPVRVSQETHSQSSSPVVAGSEVVTLGERFVTELTRAQSVVDLYTCLFGVEILSGDMSSPVYGMLRTAMSAGSPDAHRVSADERAQLKQNLGNSGLTVQDVDHFADRWNRTMEYYAAGIMSVSEVPAGQSVDFIAFDVLGSKIEAAGKSIQDDAADGYTDVFEGVFGAYADLSEYANRYYIATY